MSKPRYPHHCKNCTYLGDGCNSDLYFCTSPRPTLEMRHGEPAFFSSRVAVDMAWRWIAEFDATAPVVKDVRAALHLAARAGLVDKCDAEAALAGVLLPDVTKR